MNTKKKILFSIELKTDKILYIHVLYLRFNEQEILFTSIRACQATLNGFGGQRPNDTLPLSIEIQFPDNLKAIALFCRYLVQ